MRPSWTIRHLSGSAESGRERFKNAARHLSTRYFNWSRLSTCRDLWLEPQLTAQLPGARLGSERSVALEVQLRRAMTQSGSKRSLHSCARSESSKNSCSDGQR